jgi:hypothetical protein
MKKYSVLMTGILSLALVFGLALAGCDLNGDDDNNNGSNDQPLPATKGENALGGKTYFEWDKKIEFTASGTYTMFYGSTKGGEKYIYSSQETGSYAWNAEAKTVTAKPEKIAIWYDEINGYGTLLARAEFRAAQKKLLDDVSKEEQAEELEVWGFSDMDEYLDFVVDFCFSNTTYAYSFSTDTKALFLQKKLPADSGTNVLAGQTYNGLKWNGDSSEKDPNKVYTFAADGTYTFVDNTSTLYKKPAKTGKYSVDTKLKWVYLQPTTVNGKDRETYYSERPSDSGHYPDGDASRAGETNGEFLVDNYNYDSENKTLY